MLLIILDLRKELENYVNEIRLYTNDHMGNQRT